MENNAKQIGIAVIGCGNRSASVVRNLLRDSNGQVKIVSMYDPNPKMMDWFKDLLNVSGMVLCQSYEEAIATPGVDWVMVFSPNVWHREHIEAAFRAKKHVFSEKPLATSIEDCQAIYEAHQASGCTFATGFVLRYSKLYQKVKELLDSGEFGRILAIHADENIPPAHGGYIMRNWRRFTANAGPHILEKCCHDLDLINWYCQSLPSKVAAFGSLDFFKPNNEGLVEKYGDKTFHAWEDLNRCEESAFSSEKDLMDTQVCIAQYRNGIKVTFTATMSNALPERRMYFSCTEGNIIIEIYNSIVEYRKLGEEEKHVINFKADGHGGGDSFIMKALFDVMVNGGEPKCSGNEGLESAVFSMALDKAMRTGQVVDLEPVWKSLHR